MAENDSKTLFITGSTNWIRQYGTKVWRSTNAGDSFELVLHQYNWDTGNFTAWDAEWRRVNGERDDEARGAES